MTEPGFIFSTISAVISFGAVTPPMRAVVMTTSAPAQCLAISSACFW